MSRSYILLGEGRNRQVWRRGNYVFKFPMNTYGVDDNYHEAETYKRSLSEPMYCQYARCRIVLPYGTVLVMEFAGYPGPGTKPFTLSDGTVDDTYHGIMWSHMRHLPAWCDSIDCGQVGYNRAGKIVAYDYGLH